MVSAKELNRGDFVSHSEYGEAFVVCVNSIPHVLLDYKTAFVFLSTSETLTSIKRLKRCPRCWNCGLGLSEGEDPRCDLQTHGCGLLICPTCNACNPPIGQDHKTNELRWRPDGCTKQLERLTRPILTEMQLDHLKRKNLTLKDGKLYDVVSQLAAPRQPSISPIPPTFEERESRFRKTEALRLRQKRIQKEKSQINDWIANIEDVPFD